MTYVLIAVVWTLGAALWCVAYCLIRRAERMRGRN